MIAMFAILLQTLRPRYANLHSKIRTKERKCGMLSYQQSLAQSQQ